MNIFATDATESLTNALHLAIAVGTALVVTTAYIVGRLSTQAQVIKGHGEKHAENVKKWDTFEHDYRVDQEKLIAMQHQQNIHLAEIIGELKLMNQRESYIHTMPVTAK